MYLIYVYGLMFKKRNNSIEYINIKTKIKKMFVSTKSIYFVDLSSGPKRRAQKRNADNLYVNKMCQGFKFKIGITKRKQHIKAGIKSLKWVQFKQVRIIECVSWSNLNILERFGAEGTIRESRS